MGVIHPAVDDGNDHPIRTGRQIPGLRGVNVGVRTAAEGRGRADRLAGVVKPPLIIKIGIIRLDQRPPDIVRLGVQDIRMGLISGYGLFHRKIGR